MLHVAFKLFRIFVDIVILCPDLIVRTDSMQSSELSLHIVLGLLVADLISLQGGLYSECVFARKRRNICYLLYQMRDSCNLANRSYCRNIL